MSQKFAIFQPFRYPTRHKPATGERRSQGAAYAQPDRPAAKRAGFSLIPVRTARALPAPRGRLAGAPLTGPERRNRIPRNAATDMRRRCGVRPAPIGGIARPLASAFRRP